MVIIKKIILDLIQYNVEGAQNPTLLNSKMTKLMLRALMQVVLWNIPCS
jgi:hypothetical protein